MLGFLRLFMVSTIITTNVPSSVYNLYVQIGKKNIYTINIYLMLCYMSAKRRRQKQTIPEGEGKKMVQKTV